MQLLIGLVLGILIAFIAWRLGSLTLNGAVAAAMTGGAIFGLGGFAWAVPLLTFFVSSSLLSHVFKRRKAVFDEKFSKSSRRDGRQVLANGGLGILFVTAASLWPHLLWYFAYLGAMAAVNGDTWATEIGVLSRRSPRLITTGKVVAGGTSGGISALGTLAALSGAALIGVMGFLVGEIRTAPGLIGLVGIAGLSGALCDSLLGATFQAIYRCPTCDKETERHPTHICGTQTIRLRGWKWLDNDWVNFLSSGIGAISAIGWWWLLVDITGLVRL